MNIVDDFWLSDKPFPERVVGDGMFVALHDNSYTHVMEMVKMQKNNPDDFTRYATVGEYPNFEKGKVFIENRRQMAEKHWIADYAIHAKDGKTVGVITFVLYGYKTLGVIYFVDKNYRGLGFVSRALRILEPEMAKLGYEKLLLEIHKENKNSVAVAERNHYNFEETDGEVKNFYKDITAAAGR